MPHRATDIDIKATAALEHRRHGERSIVCCAVRSSAGHHVCQVLEHPQAVSGRRRDVESDAPPHWSRVRVCCIICARNARDLCRCRVWWHGRKRTGCGVTSSDSGMLRHERPCDCPPRRFPCSMKAWPCEPAPTESRRAVQSAQLIEAWWLRVVCRLTPADWLGRVQCGWHGADPAKAPWCARR